MASHTPVPVRHMLVSVLFVVFTVLISTPAIGQTVPPPATPIWPGTPVVGASRPLGQMIPAPAATVDLAGPRFGVTLLSDGVVEKLAERNIAVRPYVTQFGWQFERQFFTRDSGTTMVTEWVVLLGGLEQDVVLPSLSWLVGVRTRDGIEFGVGPNITPAGTALVFATGVTLKTGVMNVPLNIAIVPSRAGTRVTLVTGFSLRRR